MTGRIMACAFALVASTRAAQAAPDVDAAEKAFAALLAGQYTATSCSDTRDLGHPPQYVAPLVMGADGHITGPSVDMSMFDPAAEFGLEMNLPGPQQPSAEFTYNLYARGYSFSIKAGLDDSPGSSFLEAGKGRPNANVDVGTNCGHVDLLKARVATDKYSLQDLVTELMNTGAATVTGSCRSMANFGGASRQVQFRVGANAVTVDGVTLPLSHGGDGPYIFGVGGRFADGTLNASFRWADGSLFHAERLIGSPDFETFGYTLAGHPDAKEMYCTVGS